MVLVTASLEPRCKPLSLRKAADIPRPSALPVLLMALLFATGMEIHHFLQARPLLARFADEAQLPWLSPTLRVACCLGLWIAPAVIRRRGCRDLLVETALLRVGLVLSGLAGQVTVLVPALLWGVVALVLVWRGR